MFKRKNITACMILAMVASCGSPKKSTRPYSGTVKLVSQIEEELKDPVIKDVIIYDRMQIKYASLLRVTPQTIQNKRLYYFLDKWINTPYRWGGTDEKGIDCSAFLQRLLADVYNIKIPRTSVGQFFTNRIEVFASEKYLSEGDLVFFRTLKNTVVSHVGLYLHNRMFVNCSSSKGVSIGNLDDPYWKSKYVAAGRVRFSPY